MSIESDRTRSVSGGIEISIKVIPSASRDRIAGWLGSELKIQVAAPPERGKANQAVVTLLASVLEVSPRDVAVVSGATAQRKVIRVRGVTREDVTRALGPS